MAYFDDMRKRVEVLRHKDEIIILAIETSCDETSAAVVKNGRTVLSNKISSQIELHRRYGGVVPEIASRKHVEMISPIIDEALEEAGIGFEQLDCIAVTFGPGLVGALLVGMSVAKALAYALRLPLVGVDHIEGHISANYIAHPELEPPFLCLVVSGGHTHLVWVKDYGEYSLIGQTRDDAAGEAYDKVARALGLSYPGGPAIDSIAKQGNPEAVQFPRAYMEEDNFDFSFSGLKTAVLNYLNSLEQRNESYSIADIAASFQQAVVDVLVDKTIKAAQKIGVTRIALAGGVAANSSLRECMKQKAEECGFELYYPSPVLCTDNAAMIACAAYYSLMKGKIHDLLLTVEPSFSNIVSSRTQCG
ncbi:MAG: tRNA N6-adenosine threonylcarbamoyltransferase [Clostridiales bacterium]|nr:tRNA N6-adenosine threonylcarbamoyltransferase [Clostridiales bacterium]